MPESQGVPLLSNLESQFRFTTILGYACVSACVHVHVCVSGARGGLEEERGMQGERNACASEPMKQRESDGENETEKKREARHRNVKWVIDYSRRGKFNVVLSDSVILHRKLTSDTYSDLYFASHLDKTWTTAFINRTSSILANRSIDRA
jgi:hypothetical protein